MTYGLIGLLKITDFFSYAPDTKYVHVQWKISMVSSSSLVYEVCTCNPLPHMYSTLYFSSRLMKQIFNCYTFQNRILSRIRRSGKGCGYNGLEIFAFLLFLVYLLQFLNELLMNAMFNIMINGEQVRYEIK